MTYLRLFYILWIISSYRLDTFLKKSVKLWPLKFLIIFNPLAWFRGQRKSRGKRLRIALIKLGPIFVKFGQVLSTRPDLLPADLITELSKLQDQVPAFGTKQVKNILQNAYQQPIENIFKQFDEQPLASASVAQVHAAILPDNSDVVVKLIRPNIEKTIRKDIQVLYLLARLANKYLPNADYLHLTEVVSEFEITIHDELNMRHEAENANQLRDNFINSDLLYVPKVYWPYVRDKVLVMERIYGIRISDVETLNAKKANLKKLAEDGVEIFYTQVFRDKFFHADMHPGNIFVNIDNPAEPRYCGIDFGIMGKLSDNDCFYLSENFLAFFNRDYHRVVELHIESGWVPKDTSVPKFEAEIRRICDPMFQKPLNEISFGEVLVNLFKVAQQFNMHVQPQLVLLQKTLLNVEGLGRQLYPELDLWQTAKPILEKIMGKSHPLSMRLLNFKSALPHLSLNLSTLPTTVAQVLNIFS